MNLYTCEHDLKSRQIVVLAEAVPQDCGFCLQQLQARNLLVDQGFLTKTIYIYICTASLYVHIHIHIYIYIENETQTQREREREGELVLVSAVSVWRRSAGHVSPQASFILQARRMSPL